MNKIKKAIVGTLTLMLIVGLNPIAAHAEWKKDNTGWWYAANGSYYHNMWYLENGKWYYFDDNGYMVTGWKLVNGLWYYLYSDGSMASDTYIGQYYVDSSGEWIENYQPTATNNNSSIKNSTKASKGSSTNVEGISVTFPDTWNIVKTNGYTTYYIGDAKTNVNMQVENMQGYSPKEYLQSGISFLKEKGICSEVNTSTQTVSGKTADVLKYTSNYSGAAKDIRQVILYDSKNAYIFTLSQDNSISDSHLKSFNQMLDTVSIN